MAYTLHQRDLVKEAFFQISGGKLFIRKNQIDSLLKILGINGTEEDVFDLYSKCKDLQSNEDEIYFKPFLTCLANIIQTVQTTDEMTFAFQKFDTNNQGFITKNDLKAQLSNKMNADVEPELYDYLIKSVASESEDKIDFTTFSQLVKEWTLNGNKNSK